MGMTAGRILSFFIGLAVLVSLQSCTAYKNISYFRDVPDTSRLSLKTARYNVLHIQKGDMLTVSIATIDPDANAIFAQPPQGSITQFAKGGAMGSASATSMGGSSPSAGATPMAGGYLVNDLGPIE